MSPHQRMFALFPRHARHIQSENILCMMTNAKAYKINSELMMMMIMMMSAISLRASAHIFVMQMEIFIRVLPLHR